MLGICNKDFVVCFHISIFHLVTFQHLFILNCSYSSISTILLFLFFLYRKMCKALVVCSKQMCWVKKT